MLKIDGVGMGTMMMNVREKFPRGFIKSVKWLSRIGERQKAGRFFKENLCRIIWLRNKGKNKYNQDSTKYVNLKLKLTTNWTLTKYFL